MTVEVMNKWNTQVFESRNLKGGVGPYGAWLEF
jgi:hypothetical protein